MPLDSLDNLGYNDDRFIFSETVRVWFAILHAVGEHKHGAFCRR